jgi:hypothetical protein
MGYTVHHVDGDGAIQLQDLTTLDEALARFETLRNDGRTSQVRVFREIPIEVRTYYKVVTVEEPTDAPPEVPVVAAVPAPVEATVDAAVEDLPEPAPRREPAVRLQPPPGAMLIGPAPEPAAPREPREEREPTAHRSLFSRG